MVYDDLREFIQALEKTGDLIRVQKQVDWDLEVGAINRLFYERRGPALWFENIKDYPPGYSILAGSLGTFRRVSVALGLSPDTPLRDLYAEIDSRLHCPVKPVTVDNGPCQEIVETGEAVNLYEFPVPMLHEGDGGRYIGTWDLVVCQDPDTGWTNWGMYRFMVHDDKTMVGHPMPASHLGTILRERYAPKGEPMPMSLVLGADPLSHVAALTSYKTGKDEVELAGALRQKPVELVKCLTSPLLVPARAEIVIEGEVLPNATAPEGPFGEYTGYRQAATSGGVVCRVKAVTHRQSPILTTICIGMPLDDNSVMSAITAALTIKDGLTRRGIPVTDVYVPPEGVALMVVVGVHSGGRRVVEDILNTLTRRRALMSKIIVVDKDVDVFDMSQVIHALATKCHPVRGILANEWVGKGSSSTPCYSPEERRLLKGATVAFDCTWPTDWDKDTEVPVRSSFRDSYPKELQERVLQEWERYLPR